MIIFCYIYIFFPFQKNKMSSTRLPKKEKSIIINKNNLDKSNNTFSNNININSSQNNINPDINNTSQIKDSKNTKIITQRIEYSLTDSNINPQQINAQKGEPTEFNRNFNGEIKLDRGKREKTVVCWNCQSLLMVKEGWQIVECSECNKLNRISTSQNEGTRNIDVGKSYGNLNNKGDVPYMYGIVICPMCESENRFSKYATNINCYKCGYTIFLKESPFNNGINNLRHSYDFTYRNNLNYGYINPPPYNPNVIQIRGIIPVPPMIPYYNNDYTLLKILELLKKKPKKTYVPYPIFPHYRFDDEPKQQIRYVPVNEKKEPKNEDFKITIRKKPKNKFSYSKNRYNSYNNDIFEKVFFTKVK